jgi:integrase
MPSYKIGRLGKRFVVNVFDDAGKRLHRYRLNATTAREAETEAPGVFHELARPRNSTVAELWSAYVVDHHGRAIIATMEYTWKALRSRFGSLHATMITADDCRAHAIARGNAGIKDRTIATELGHLRMVLRWAEKRSIIDRAPHIERPSAPRRKDRHLTREQCRQMIGAASLPHIKLYVVLALATGARNAALLELKWDRCDFERGLIDLRNPDIRRPHKSRAIVPMNRAARAALLEAKEGALSDYVIEWAGKRVASVKRGLKATARAAGIDISVSPHLFRHSAAVHMAEAGIDMDTIAQYLGHEDVAVTRRVYARFSPDYLRAAADVLQYDDICALGSMNRKSTSHFDEATLNN